ncbi:unnamed protein product [Auanema sp. JU1783]|nr:unnamed protein product [Auanema sp. JU1783]
MGNQHPRKRFANQDEDCLPAKKARFDNEIPERKYQKKVSLRKSVGRFSFCSPTWGLRKCSNDDGSGLSSQHFANRCRSLDGIGENGSREDDGFKRPNSTNLKNYHQTAASCSRLTRPEYPVPWLVALFLPEFPSRSAVNENNFTLSNEIGNGSFGHVFRAISKSDPSCIYAMKIQEKSKILGRNATLQVKREASLLRLLPPYVFVSRLYATWQTRSKLFSLLQYPVGGLGDLFTVWREHGNMKESQLRIYAAEIACALDFIHRHGIIYRDLKLENVILDADCHIQIIDFGLAKQLRNGQRTKTICGTLQYMSPIVAVGEPYAHEVDWWSYGVLLHILFTGRYPYPNAEAVHHSELRFIDYSTPYGCSKAFGNLLDRLLTTTKEHRLGTFAVLHAHPFFQDINFEDVEARKLQPAIHFDNLRSRNSDFDEKSILDGEENWRAFEEKYEFNDFACFSDSL